MDNLPERLKKFYPLAGMIFVLTYMSVRYISGLHFLAGISVFMLLFLTLEPIYPFCLLVLLLWVPRALNYIFLKDVFAAAPIAEVFSYMLLAMYAVSNILKIRNKPSIIFKMPFQAPILIFILGNFLSYLLGGADDRIFAYILFRQNSFYAIVLYVISASITKGAAEAKKIGIALILSNLLLAIFIFHSFYFGGNVIDRYVPERLGGEFYVFGQNYIGISSIMLGNQMATIIPFVAGIAFLNTKIWYKLFGCFAVFILGAVLIATGTRGAWMASLIGILPVILLALSLKRASVFYKTVFTIVILLSLSVILFASRTYLDINEYLAYRLKSAMFIFNDPSLIERMEIWVASFKAFLQNPLGMGFREQYPLGFMTVYPHSLYVGLFLSSGFLGAVGFFWFLAAWFRAISRSLKNAGTNEKTIFAAAIGSSLAFLTYGIFEHPAYNPIIVMPTIWIIWGCAIGLAGRIFEGGKLNELEK